MSQWLESTNNSNKLKQSYFRDFVDVSGEVLIRNNHSLKLFDSLVPTRTQFSINSNGFRVFDDNDQNYHDISHVNLKHIRDLTSNVQAQLDNINRKTINFTANNANNNTTLIELDAINNNVIIRSTDLSINHNIRVGGDASFNSRVDICGNFYAQYPNNSIPPSAIIGGVCGGTSDQVTFNDDDFAIIKPASESVSNCDGIIRPSDIIFEDNFALIKDDIEPYVFPNVQVTQSLTVNNVARFTGSVNVNTPIDGSNATNKTYVDNTVKSKSLALSLTINGLTNSDIASLYLSKIFPANEHSPNTICRIVCTDNADITIRQFKLLSDTWTYQMNL